MTPNQENTPTPNEAYRLADQMINQALSLMDNESHIEYGSTMARRSSPSKLKRWIQRLRQLLNR